MKSRMSRTAAKKRFTEADLAAQTAGIECRKDSGVIDETPGAYKDIDAVIAAQRDLVEVVARLDTLLCIKGGKVVKRLVGYREKDALKKELEAL